jgi:hypothetical protein
MVSRPAVLQFGLRGTEGILAAAGGDSARITIVEPAGELVALVREDLAGFSGGWASADNVEIRAEGARNFLARDGRRFDLIEMPEISSVSFSSLGIHAAGETFLLTREGIRSSLSHLSGRGLLVFSGWLKTPPRESVRILSTIRRELETDSKGSAPMRVIMAKGWGSFVVLVRRIPFSAVEIGQARQFCEERGFRLAWPADSGEAAADEEERVLLDTVKKTLAGSESVPAVALFDVSPVTDDAPYFHRFLKLSALPEFRRLLGNQWIPYVEWGLVFLVLSLAVSLAIAAAFLLLPLSFTRFRNASGGTSLAVYFSALGLGYMLVELTYLKLGILILGDPIRAATAAIGGFAFFSGFGSAISAKFESPRTMSVKVFPAIALLAAAGFSMLFFGTEVLLSEGGALRTAAFMASLAPAAFLMGIPFPAALSRLSALSPSSISFAWGINGFFSVAGASLASIGALWIGFRGTVIAGSLIYLAAGALYPRIGKKGNRSSIKHL